MLTDQEIKKFQQLYKNEFGQEISRERVLDEGLKFARMVEVVKKVLIKNGGRRFQTTYPTLINSNNERGARLLESN